MGAAQVWKLAGEQGELESKIEERIINRFAAELLMPAKQFRKTFWVHREKLGLDPSKLRLPDLIRVMVLQFVNAFSLLILVPFTLGFALIRAKTRVTKFTLLKSGGGKCKI